MKNFFTSLFGTLAGLVVFVLGTCFCGLLLLILVVSAGKTPPQTIEPGSYLVFDLEANITDSPESFSFGSLTSEDAPTLQLRALTRTLRAAARDKRIAGVLLTGALSPSGYGSGYAALKEVRAALQEVRAAGKPVKAFLSSASTRDYYLASAASEIVLDPYGMLLMPGLAARPMFYAGAFEKFGIGVQVTRVGKYKSAVEPYTRRDLSPENREQLEMLLGDLWTDLLADIAGSRGVTPAAIQQLVDAEGLIRADAAKAAKLVDRIAYRDEIIAELKNETGRPGANEPFAQIKLADYMEVAAEPGLALKAGASQSVSRSGCIAVVYAEGEIVDGEAEQGYVGGTNFSRELRRLRQDDDVKAIVLRVNSPGGSAAASEEIQRELRLAQEVKPVIVSMGAYAASGGYWIAAYGERIFAEPTTITGSIGVFGIFFDVEKLTANLGLTFDSVKTGKMADALTITRPKTDQELAVMQRMVDWTYAQFIDKVAEARKLDRAKVEEIAQGRVWSGKSALDLGLVDELGGLDAALRHAAHRVGLGSKPRLEEFPRKKDFSEVLSEMLDQLPTSRLPVRHGLASRLSDRVEQELKTVESLNDPRGVYARLPLGLTVE